MRTAELREALIPAVATATAWPVHSVPPPGARPPYVVVGDPVASTRMERKDGQITRHVVHVHLWADGSSPVAVEREADSIVDALDGASMALAAGNLVMLRHQGTEFVRADGRTAGPDRGEAHAIVRLLAVVSG